MSIQSFSKSLCCGGPLSVGLALAFASPACLAIDCQRATGNVELAICRDKDIVELDQRLALALAQTLEDHPIARQKILAQQRVWIAKRNASCKKYAIEDPKMHQCLEEAYVAQIHVLNELDRMDTGASESVPVDAPDLKVCETLLKRYRPLANAHAGLPPIAALARADTTGVKVREKPDQVILDYHSDLDLVAWAKGQHPPVVLSTELTDLLEGQPQGGSLEQAPGLPYFMLARLEGSMACDMSLFFVVKNNRAFPATAPLSAKDLDCQPSGQFARLDSAPLYVREHYDYRPGMKASVDVATWRGDHFASACTISLSYLPSLSATTLNDHEDFCKVSDCDGLRKASFEIVKNKLANRLLPEKLEQELTPEQRVAYQAEVVAANEIVDPEASDDVVLVPYIYRGSVYLVRIADRTIGWRDYADQSVKFQFLEKGKLIDFASLYVGVLKGELIDASVSP